MYSCPRCDHSFDEKSALCEDWRIPEKSFGCPACKAFFSRKLQSNHWSEFLIPITLFPYLIMTVFDLEVSAASHLGAALAVLAMAGSCVYLYFLWRRRKIPSVILEPVEETSAE